MNTKRVIAAALSTAMVLSVAGCDKSGGKSNDKTKKQIGEIMESYTDALSDYDSAVVLELTNWDENSEDYEKLEWMLDLENFREADGEGFAECIKYIASKISYDYDLDDLEVDGKEATLKITYEVIDWETVYYASAYESFEEVLSALKSQKDTKSYKGKITFELDGKEWKISKTTKLNEVFLFETLIPNICETIPTEPTETDPTEPSTSASTSTGGTGGSGAPSAEIYAKAIDAYLGVLKSYEPFIRSYETVYGQQYCGLYDLNSDGIPELYFLAADNVEDANTSASFYMFYYNEYAGEAIQAVKVPEIDYQAEGANFIIYVTASEMIISHGYGEEALHHIDNDIYSEDLLCFATYRCDVSYEYDPENDTENYTYQYYLGINTSFTPIEEGFYKMMLEYYVNNAVSVICQNYNPPSGDLEARLDKVPRNASFSYDDMVSFLESVV